MEFSLDYALAMDQSDPLRSFRNKFLMPERDGMQCSYFLGNSLGLQPRSANNAIQEILRQWQDHGVEGFFEGEKPWLSYHDQLTPLLAKVVGAKPAELVIMNQLSVNLHLMMVSFYRPQGKRVKIICEAKAFPSDQYIFETQVKYHGLDPASCIIEVGPRSGTHYIETDDILAAIEENKDEVALVLFSGINYYSGQVFDMQKITEAGQRAGAIVGFDLAHAAGNIELRLHDWGADFACWCSYKYLNSGPGAIGGVYIHERHHSNTNIPRFAGWWGYDAGTRFKMEKGFVPDAGANGWQLSTPSLLLYATHKASLELFEEAGMENLHAKRKRLNVFLWFMLDAVQTKQSEMILEVITPRNEMEHGCQISLLVHKNGRKIYDALMQRGIMVDWREPNVIRLAPVPFYNTFVEVYNFATALSEIITSLK